MKPTWIVAFTVAMASAPPAVFAQSLVDVARQEEARRANVRKPSKVFTNATLSPAPDQTPAGAQEQSPPSNAPVPAAAGNSSAATVAPAPVVDPPAAALDEKRWRDQAAALRLRVAAARKELDALAGASHDDPREQAMLEALRQRRQVALTLAEDDQRRFEKLADAAKVPKAWLHEPQE